MYDAVITFICLHLFIYPASNGFNSFYDKDEGSIGGVEKPLPVSSQLLWFSLLLDLAGILLAATINFTFMLMVLVYGLVSKAYSHPTIRLKKYPIPAWLSIFIFQGGFTYFMAISGIMDLNFEFLFMEENRIYLALFSSFSLGGVYPVTQIYQHEQDRKAGDNTLSMKLGKLGTLLWFGFFNFISLVFMVYYRWQEKRMDFLFLLVGLVPVLLFHSWWLMKVKRDPLAANFKNTMRLNLLASLSLNSIFVLSILLGW